MSLCMIRYAKFKTLLVITWLYGLPEINTWSLFTTRTDVFPQDLAKPRSHDIYGKTFPIALKLDRHIGSSANEMPIEFQSNAIIITISQLRNSRNLTVRRPSALWLKAQGILYDTKSLVVQIKQSLEHCRPAITQLFVLQVLTTEPQ